MNDDKLIEAMARAMANENGYPEWRDWMPEAAAALEAYRIATQDDGK